MMRNQTSEKSKLFQLGRENIEDVGEDFDDEWGLRNVSLAAVETELTANLGAKRRSLHYDEEEAVPLNPLVFPEEVANAVHDPQGRDRRRDPRSLWRSLSGRQTRHIKYLPAFTFAVSLIFVVLFLVWFSSVSSNAALFKKALLHPEEAASRSLLKSST